MMRSALLRSSAPAAKRYASSSTSAAAKSSTSASHTTDTYTKEVDSTPATDPKVHRVDPSSERVQKPYEAPSNPYSQTGVEAGVKNAQGKPETKKQQ
ncbi:hypothetical protein MIND_01384000 [Mycena indigotica]|uniref:Uncharacterized protein n=1 Tax=Mycena indigotica TaxID=2126181 RepID=A0A8H6RZQ3_9AGAR|nr:uncharacterized protein MIND_01384000 [Mycena indigotica]KAF7289227.1 hypothetical protein MIND_01384000 [Mycena indigotica]